MHVTKIGHGARVVLVHGSQWQHPDKNFAHQRGLAGRFELWLPHRRGYGESPSAQRTDDFEPDVSDIGGLLGEGAHLIGESYGAWVALLAALRWPTRIKSLTLIEPIAFYIARQHTEGRDEGRGFVAALIEVFAKADPTQPEIFAAEFLSVMRGQRVQPRPVSEESRQGILAMLTEARTWDVNLDVSPLAAAPFPKLIVSGGWQPAFEVICDTLAERMKAQRVVIRGRGHSPHDAEDGRPFNTAWLGLIGASERA